MISIFKQNSLRFKLITSAFLLISIIFLITGCTSTEKVKASDTNMKNMDILTGKVKVQGEGVSITLIDEPTAIDKQDRYYYIVHDWHIKKIVNLLENAGAEAISVNDERVISTNKIKANEMKIRVNNNEFESPFIIKAIGNSEVLMNDDELKNELDYWSNKNHIGIKIEKKDKLLIPQYTGSIDFKYANLVEINN